MEADDVLHRIEIYSQGDLQRIADDELSASRLTLIDRPHAADVEKLKSERWKASQNLRDLGPRIRAIRTQIGKRREEVKSAPDLTEQLRRMEEQRPKSSPQMEASRQLFERRKKVLAAIKDALAAQDEAIPPLTTLRNTLSRLTTAMTTIEAQEQTEAAAMLEALRRSAGIVRRILELRTELESCPLDDVARALGDTFERLNEQFYRLRQEEQEINEALKKEEVLRKQIELLEKAEADLKSLEKAEADLLRDRQTLRRQIADIGNRIYQLRMEEIERINTEHGDVVYLAMQTGAHSPEYIRRLSSLLSGSRIRNQEEVAADIAKKIPPTELIDIVEAGNAQRIATVLGRDLGQMTRVVAQLADHEELYELETNVPEDQLQITMYDNGQPKPVESLSKGQKATALLPLILRPLPYPLLFDQPEDDLDNSFIFKSLIQNIRRLKNTRQLIFVTHNANIPVLGGADSLIVMTMKGPKEANAAKCGSVDECKQEILDLLEGGVEAFQERERQYADLLSVPKGR
jgi:DNA repair ATPase RecN